jgi:steroid delta-isomerase-like uncharacterized protein
MLTSGLGRVASAKALVPDPIRAIQAKILGAVVFSTACTIVVFNQPGGNLMSEENKALVRRWFDEVWNKGRAEAIDELFAENGIAHGLSDDPANPIKGPSNFRPFHTTFREAFPNMMIVVEDMVAEGDKVAARCSVRGRHEGNFMGCAATQSPVEFSGITIVRIYNGKIVEAWNNFDFMVLHKQVGLIA